MEIMLEASKKENISLNGVEIEDTFAETFTLMEISPAMRNLTSDFHFLQRNKPQNWLINPDRRLFYQNKPINSVH
jgi:hypothetical protein